MMPKDISFITPTESTGTAGSEPTAGASDAGSSIGGAAGMAPADEVAGAGAGGGGECEGDYECPEVQYVSHATIKVDLPTSVAEAADAIFTACRNSECYSAKGSAQADPHEGSWVLTKPPAVYPIFLSFDSSEAAPFAVLDWKFYYEDRPAPSDASDHYSLTVQATTEVAPTTLFDEQVQYGIEIVDENGPFEHYCSHCFEVPAATVDRRSMN